mmetsp:Transcript_11809/g.37744  ORF Transcript_11809/g.37744 Transcript_11809/m.37744 type:complete len:202 (-) Transcript_11809:1427-2032(-)
MMSLTRAGDLAPTLSLLLQRKRIFVRVPDDNTWNRISAAGFACIVAMDASRTKTMPAARFSSPASGPRSRWWPGKSTTALAPPPHAADPSLASIDDTVSVASPSAPSTRRWKSSVLPAPQGPSSSTAGGLRAPPRERTKATTRSRRITAATIGRSMEVSALATVSATVSAAASAAAATPSTAASRPAARRSSRSSATSTST